MRRGLRAGARGHTQRSNQRWNKETRSHHLANRTRANAQQITYIVWIHSHSRARSRTQMFKWTTNSRCVFAELLALSLTLPPFPFPHFIDTHTHTRRRNTFCMLAPVFCVKCRQCTLGAIKREASATRHKQQRTNERTNKLAIKATN